jgi:hypothetical protein
MSFPIARPAGHAVRGVACAGALFLAAPIAAGQVSADEAQVTETVIAGTADDFLVARHLRIEGSNRAIGRALARIARDRHGVELRTAPTAFLRAQEAFYRRHYPEYWQRAEGVAEVYGVADRMQEVDCLSLGYPVPPGGCSVVYYPPDVMQDGEAALARNYDFTTGTFDGREPAEGELPATARPYLLELHPDEGHASISAVSYDLLGAALDGVNAAGLTVALLADDELIAMGHDHPEPYGKGLGEADVVRYLLDRCSTAEEARAALRNMPLYYSSVPCHYLVGDATGDSFVFELSADRATRFVHDGRGQPLLTTNFMLHLHRDLDHLPREASPLGSFRRYETLRTCLRSEAMPFTVEFVRRSQGRVAATGGGKVPARTLWHATYRPASGKVLIDFYLGDDEEGRIRRSPLLTFSLKNE